MTQYRVCALIVFIITLGMAGCQPKDPTPNPVPSTSPTHVIKPVSSEEPVITDLPGQPTETSLATAIPTATPFAPDEPVAGMEISYQSDLGFVDQLDGVYWIRRNALNWALIEPVQGARQWNEAAALEIELSQISAMGMQAVLIVRGAPEWALSIPGQLCSAIKPEAFQTFVAFLAEAVERYSQPPYNVKYWELGNEPDVDPSLIPGTSPFGCWGDLDDPNYYGGGYYAEMLKVTYPAIKTTDPDAQVLIGGLLMDCDPVKPPETSPGSGQPRYCTPSRYLEGILVNGGGDFFDGVSFHAYDYYQGAEGRFGNGNWYSAWNTTGPVTAAKARYVRSILAAYGHPDKFIMNTENALLCGRDGNEPECQNDIYNSTKAYYVAQSNAMALSEGLRANIWYDLQGWRGSALVDKANQPLPAFTAYQYSIKALSGMAYWGRVSTVAGISGYEFRQAERVIWLVWSLDGNIYEMTMPDSTVGIYDVYGNSLPVSQTMTITIAPIYVEWIIE